jgi:hypothetical protein
MPIGIARTRFFHSGATPRCTLFTSVSGLNTRIAPTRTSRTWVRKSTTASPMFTLADSFVPTMLIRPRIAITMHPTITSPGPWRSSSQNSPPT